MDLANHPPDLVAAETGRLTRGFRELVLGAGRAVGLRRRRGRYRSGRRRELDAPRGVARDTEHERTSRNQTETETERLSA
jgi:hypothetical protein